MHTNTSKLVFPGLQREYLIFFGDRR